jgi:phosphonate transport system substrate-binding protein
LKGFIAIKLTAYFRHSLDNLVDVSPPRWMRACLVSIMKKSFSAQLFLALCALFSMTGAQADIVFAINEGVSYGASPLSTVERFREISNDLEKILKQPVTVSAVTNYEELAAGLKKQSYDLAYVHPAHHSIRAMKDSGYRLVAVTKGWTDYSANFMVNANSGLSTLADLKGKKVGAPDADSITSVLMRSTLRELLGAEQPTFQYVRLQDAVPFMVVNNFTASGVSASKSVVKQWEAGGGKVIGKSKPIPIKHLIASAKITPEQRRQLTDYFTTLEDIKDGKKRLDAANVQGFMAYDEKTLVALATWLGV